MSAKGSTQPEIGSKLASPVNRSVILILHVNAHALTSPAPEQPCYSTTLHRGREVFRYPRDELGGGKCGDPETSI